MKDYALKCLYDFNTIFHSIFFYTLMLSSLPITIYLLFFTKYWWLMLLYYLWIYCDRNVSERGGRPWNWYRRTILLNSLGKYYPNKLRFVDLDAFKRDKNYLFCSFPHGIMSTGFSNWFMPSDYLNKILPGFNVYLVTLNSAFYYPFYREFMLATGNISNTPQSINYVLSRKDGGNLVGLIPGGAEESIYTEPGVYKTIVHRRKGFAKIALKNGACLVPCLAFGEVDIYDQYRGTKLIEFQKLVKKYLNFVPILNKGRFGLPFWPLKKPLNIVGKNISCY